MSLTTITIGANDYSSYASVAEADAYLAVDPVRDAAWTALSTDEKGQKLVAATRRLDLLSWQGEKAVSSQATQWPRSGVTCDGVAIASGSIPQRIEDATILLAGSIAITAATADSGSSGTNTKRVKAGSAEVEFFRPKAGKALQDETAFALIQCLLSGASSASYGLASGVVGDSSGSSFTDKDAPGLVKGYP